jgi:hypothetical protein
VIQPAPSPADEPYLITAGIPEEVQGQFRIGIILIHGTADHPFRRIFFQTPGIVQRIHVPDDPVRTYTRFLGGNQP